MHPKRFPTDFSEGERVLATSGGENIRLQIQSDTEGNVLLEQIDFQGQQIVLNLVIPELAIGKQVETTTKLKGFFITNVKTTLSVVGTTTVDTPAGNFNAWEISIEAVVKTRLLVKKDFRMRLFISDEVGPVQCVTHEGDVFLLVSYLSTVGSLR